MLSTTDFRRGLKIEMDGVPYEIVDFLHVKPGKGGAFIRTKLKNMINGRVEENTFRSGEKMVKPDLESKEMQYLYREGEELVFMDMESYEQIPLEYEKVEDALKYLKENDMATIRFFKGEAFEVNAPNFVTLKITKTEPGFKGDTATGANKPATVETGAMITVPLFVEEGDTIRVDTRTGDYMERV